MGDDRGPDGTVGRALEVLDLVAGAGRPLRFAEILAMSRLPKATLHRIVRTLTTEGMLTADPDSGLYAPGVRLVRLAHAAWRQASLGPVARPHLDRLSTATGRAVLLARLDEGRVRWLDRRGNADPGGPLPQFGPAHCSAVGKAMLAFLDEGALDRALGLQARHRYTPATLTDAPDLRRELARIRADGLAVEREEHEPGAISIAMPILAAGGRVLGAVGLASTTAATTPDRLTALSPDLADAVAAIAADWEMWSPPDRRD